MLLTGLKSLSTVLLMYGNESQIENMQSSFRGSNTDGLIGARQCESTHVSAVHLAPKARRSPCVNTMMRRHPTISLESPQHGTSISGRAQIGRSVQFAPYALESTLTTLPDARRASSGTGAKPDASETRMVVLSIPLVRPCVSSGNGQEDAQPETTTDVTNALGVEDRTIRAAHRNRT